jgi:tetratricopeptide (TPR) repeat protein
MNDASETDGDAVEVIAQCHEALAANRSAESILSRLRALEPHLPATPTVRARFLTVRAIAVNRLGLASEALGDLYEARHLLERDAHHSPMAEIDRTIALVHGWRADGREAALALLRSTAAALVAGDAAAAALALIEAGRLELEIGRPDEAGRFFSAALQIDRGEIPANERARASVNFLQALVAAGQFDRAAAHLEALEGLLSTAPERLEFLVALESSRIATASGNPTIACDGLRRAEALVSGDEAAFERIEMAHVAAELALADGDAARADDLLRGVVRRYADDDLAGREIAARLLHARVLDARERRDEAERTLSAALRRALSRGLHGYAGEVRKHLAARVGGERLVPLMVFGTAIDGDASRRFVRLRPLGSGSGGTVSRAYDLELGIEVALKRIRLEGVYDTGTRARRADEVAAETAAAERIEHPGVARIHGLLTDTNGDLLLVQELVDGPTMRAAMSTPLSRPDALGLLSRIAFALAAIHSAGIVHRDLKPDNIVLRNGDSPVIVDFGLALTHPTARNTLRRGTRGYEAPEQTQGRAVTARADLYALGVIAHELLLGTRPMASAGAVPSIAEPWRRRRRRGELVGAGLDPALADLLTRLLAPHQAWRPGSAARVAARFAAGASRSAQAW